jgi:hypothetical protein
MVVGDNEVGFSNENGQLRVDARYRIGGEVVEISVLVQQDKAATMVQLQQRAMKRAIAVLESLSASQAQGN